MDNVIELNVVTSSGEYLTANSRQHPDLYWALRGGGGGTYGIVTSVTYRTHPSVPLTAIYFTANSSDNAATIKKLYTEFVRIHPDLSDAGFSGIAITTSPNDLQVTYIAVNVSQTQANQTIEPFFAFARNLTSEGLNISKAFTTPTDSFYSWYSGLFPDNSSLVGVNTEIGTRLIPRESFENNYEDIADAAFDPTGIIWAYVFQNQSPYPRINIWILIGSLIFLIDSLPVVLCLRLTRTRRL